MIFDEFTGYVLAGGKSSRMGTDKAFLKFGEKTFLENAFGILESGCAQTKIVFNKSQTHFIEKLPENSLYIFDIYENRGAIGGIHAALKDCATKFAVILAVDLPFITSEAVEILMKAAVSENVAAIVPRQSDGRLQPLCAVYRAKACLPSIENLLNEKNSISVRDFLETIHTREIGDEDLSDDENLFTNVNSPKDFEKV